MSDIDARAREAAQLLDSPLFNEALAHLEQEAIDAMIAAGVAQDRERLVASVMVKLARRLRGYFETVRDEGRFAAHRAVREPLP
jgi:hypothetical protein